MGASATGEPQSKPLCGERWLGCSGLKRRYDHKIRSDTMRSDVMKPLCGERWLGCARASSPWGSSYGPASERSEARKTQGERGERDARRARREASEGREVPCQSWIGDGLEPQHGHDRKSGSDSFGTTNMQPLSAVAGLDPQSSGMSRAKRAGGSRRRAARGWRLDSTLSLPKGFLSRPGIPPVATGVRGTHNDSSVGAPRSSKQSEVEWSRCGSENAPPIAV